LAAETTQAGEAPKAGRAELVVQSGVVDSICGAKTVRVVMNSLVKHPLYGKYIRRRSRLMVHDADSQAKVGDTVEIAECRPVSKRKAWRLVRVVKHST